MANAICTVLARGGSKGLPGKNLRPLLGRPLIAHSVLQAVRSRLFAAVAVSSDSEQILAAGREAGATHLVLRPPPLASDSAAKLPGIRHCLEEVERASGLCFDVIVDLGVTAPLRTVEDIAGCLQLLERTGASNVLSASLATHSPYFSMVEMVEGRVRLVKALDKPVFRRQDAPAVYDLNGSVYAWRRDCLYAGDGVLHPGTALYAMPAERAVDIDSEVDFRVVEALAAERGGL